MNWNTFGLTLGFWVLLVVVSYLLSLASEKFGEGVVVPTIFAIAAMASAILAGLYS